MIRTDDRILPSVLLLYRNFTGLSYWAN